MDFESSFPRQRNQFQSPDSLSPVFVSGNFQVGNLHRDIGPPPDGNGFHNRFQKPLAFRTHMGSINPPLGCRHFSQFNQLIHIGKTARRINQSGCQSQSPLVHGLIHLIFQFIQFFRGWGSFTFSHTIGTKGAMAQECPIISPNALFFQSAEESSQIFPVYFQPMFFHETSGFSKPFLSDRERSHSAVTGNIGRNPLPDFTFRPGIHKQGTIGMGMDINKPGTDTETRSINHPPGFFYRNLRSQIRYLIFSDCQVGFLPGFPGSIDYFAIFNQEVKHG